MAKRSTALTASPGAQLPERCFGKPNVERLRFGDGWHGQLVDVVRE